MTRGSATIGAIVITVAVAAILDRQVRATVADIRMCLAVVAEPLTVREPPEPWPSGLTRMSVARPPETVADVSELLDCPHVNPVPGKGPVPVGASVARPRKTKHVPPAYPPAALASGRHGLVILEAVIAENGSVRDVRVLRSVAMLDKVASEAVRQWRYAPTFYDRRPIEVVITVPIIFELPQ